MATKAEVTAWMELWKHQEDAHKNEVNTAGIDAYARGYQDALADVKALPAHVRLFKSLIGKQVEL